MANVRNGPTSPAPGRPTTPAMTEHSLLTFACQRLLRGKAGLEHGNGHEILEMVQHYGKGARQKLLAKEAMKRLTGESDDGTDEER